MIYTGSGHFHEIEVKHNEKAVVDGRGLSSGSGGGGSTGVIVQ